MIYSMVGHINEPIRGLRIVFIVRVVVSVRHGAEATVAVIFRLIVCGALTGSYIVIVSAGAAAKLGTYKPFVPVLTPPLMMQYALVSRITQKTHMRYSRPFTTALA